MIAAIYARKSTDQGDRDDETKSVARQVDHARVYALEMGWVVAEQHVYVDDGISGAEFDRRPGFLRLMTAVKARPVPFQVLVMSEESRLGREQIETGYALKQLVTAGVRLFFYLQRRERTLDSPTEKLRLAVQGFSDEQERAQASQRTADAMLRKARAGHVTGGRVFGYDNVEVRDELGHRVRVERRINEAEATAVRRIFELCAAGLGYKRIADTLNAARVLSPPPRGRGRIRAWAASTVREILLRPLYRGEVVWNQRRKRDQWGVKKYLARPESEWLRREAPQLRIVADDLWRAARERIDGDREVYLRAVGPSRSGRPISGIESPYLLTGFLECACCHGSMTVTSYDWKHSRRHAYACGYKRFRGRSVCSNGLWAPMDLTDRAVLDTLANELLCPEALDEGIRKAVEALRPSPGTVESRRTALRREQQDVAEKIARLTAAIEDGGDIPALLAALRARESRRRELEVEIAGLESLRRRTKGEGREIEAELRSYLAEWQALLRGHPRLARPMLREVLDGRLVFTPRREGAERFYDFTGCASIGRLLAGTTLAKAMVTPAGFEPAI